jgi:glycosyltransferase involved in cell wall biosynthesis
MCEECLTVLSLEPVCPNPVVVLLPAHDEEVTVGDVVRRVAPKVRGHPVEVVVIDDGSTDGTAVAARAVGAVVHSLGRNRGLGAAVRAGLAWAVERQAAAVAFLDADGEYAPEELGTLVGPILDGRADYVIGSRFAGSPRDMRPHRWLGNRVLTLGMKLLVGRWGVRGLSDGQSGYRALSPAAAAHAEIVHDFNYAQVLTLDLVAKGYRYAEVPVSYRFRRHGRSFVRLVPYLRRVVPAMWRELRTATAAGAGPSLTDTHVEPPPLLVADVSHESALLHGAIGPPSGPITLTAPHGTHHRLSGICVHQIDDVRRHHRIPIS